MIIVTGGAGFIGSNIVKALNARGECDITVVDDLTDGDKARNLADLKIADYRDKDDFLRDIETASGIARDKTIRAVLHQGACANTRESNGRRMMSDNYTYSKMLFDFCISRKIHLIYASSAAVYGANAHYVEQPEYEKPLNVYGYSKLLFDQYVRRRRADIQSDITVVGLRYFNVYGPREHHKGDMASVALHHWRQLNATGRAKLFKGSGGYADGEQQRDFVYVDDVVDVNLWLYERAQTGGNAPHGIFNVGTGHARTFNDLARAMIAAVGQGQIEYIDFPAGLRRNYQSHTQADTAALRQTGYDRPFTELEDGIRHYAAWLKQNAT